MEWIIYLLIFTHQGVNSILEDESTTEISAGLESSSLSLNFGFMIKVGPWSNCSVPCGTGYRSVIWACLSEGSNITLSFNKQPSSTDCNQTMSGNTSLPANQSCIPGHCYEQFEECTTIRCPDIINIGCWINSDKFKLMSLESASDVQINKILSDEPSLRSYPILRCALATEMINYTMFALFNNGQCWAGDGFDFFWRRGLTAFTSCNSDGTGGDRAGNVFFMSYYKERDSNVNVLPYYSAWTRWGSCNAACGGGKQNRSKSCVADHQSGTYCNESNMITSDNIWKDTAVDKYYEETTCNIRPCSWNSSLIEVPYKWLGCWVIEDGVFESLESQSLTVLDGYTPSERDSAIDKCAVATYDVAVLFALSNHECYIAVNLTTITFPRTSPSWPVGCKRHGLGDGTFDVYTFKQDPVDGQWSSWSSYKSCTRACDGGISETYRYCSNPPQENQNSSDCIGSDYTYKECNTEQCPSDFSYTHLGCFLPDPSWPNHSNQEKNYNKQFDKPQKSHPRNAKVEKCALRSYLLGFKMFALTKDGNCFSHSKMHCVDLRNISAICSEGGLGDAKHFDVYLLDKFFTSSTLEKEKEACFPQELPPADETQPSTEGMSTSFFEIQSQTTQLGIVKELSPLMEAESKNILRSVINITSTYDEVSNFTLREVLSLLRVIATNTTQHPNGSYNEYERNFIYAIDELMHERFEEKWRTEEPDAMSRLLEIMELFSLSLIENGSPQKLIIEASNVVFQLIPIMDLIKPERSILKGLVWTELIGPYLELSVDQTMQTYVAITTFTDQSSAVIHLYKEHIMKWNIAATAAIQTIVMEDINSNVTESSAALAEEDLVENIYKYQVNGSIVETSQIHPQCVYWDFNTSSLFGGAWSTSGCRSTALNNETVTCRCNHFTSFAVLMLFTEKDQNPEFSKHLSIVTYILSCLSLFFLVTSLLLYLFLDNLKSEKISLQKNLVLSLLCAQSVFVCGINQSGNRVLCGIIAGLLHYFYLSSFFWMLCEGLHLYIIIIEVFSRRKNYINNYVIGWGFPLVIVTVAAVCQPLGYGTTTSCWLSTDNGLIWAFLGPVAVIIVVNIIIGIMVIRVIIQSSTGVPGQEKESSPKITKLKAGLKGILILLPILGTSWLFGFLANFQFGDIFEYLFVITNCLQGVFVFCFHCLGNSEVRSTLQRKLKQRKLQNKVSSVQQTISSKAVTVVATSYQKDCSEERMEQQTLSRFIAVSAVRSAERDGEILSRQRLSSTSAFDAKDDIERQTWQDAAFSACSSVGDELSCDSRLDNYQEKKGKDKKIQEHIFMRPRVFSKNSRCGKSPDNK